MSAAAKKKPASRQEKPDMEPVELMRAMGGNGWFNPQSNDMIRLLRHLAKDSALPRPMLVMYAWLQWYTLTAGNRQPYANRNGIMLGLRDLADECGIEIRNARMYWAKGIAMKIWRSGEAEKDESAEGLYLCAKVDTPADDQPKEPVDGYVHTLRDGFLGKFKPYIREKLEQLSPDSFNRLAARWDRLEEIGDSAHADLLAAVRTVVGQDQDTLLREFGIEKKRLDSAKNKTDEELAEIAARQARIDRLLLPHVQQYVQTLDASVPTLQTGLYMVEIAGVHTRGNGAQNGAGSGPISVPKQQDTASPIGTPEHGPSLLEPVRPIQTLRRAGSVSRGGAALRKSSPFHEGREAVQVHAGESALLSTLTPEERQAAKNLLSQIAGVQAKHPKKFAGEIANALDKGQLTTAAKMVRTVGMQELDAFAQFIEQKAIDRALGHQLTIGLLSTIADEYRAGAADRERQRLAEIAMAEKRQAFNIQVEKNRAREQRIVDQVDQAWEQLSPAERKQMMTLARQELKVDPHWPGLTPEQKDDRAEVRVRMMLRRDIEAAAKRSGGAQ